MIVVKNTSGFSQDISDLGLSLNVGESRVLFTDEFDYEYTIQEIQNSIDLETGILNDIFILNNGEKDLTKIESLEIVGTVNRKIVNDLISEKTADIRRNTMQLAIELEALQNFNSSNKFSFFSDSFDDTDEIDITSSNYNINNGTLTKKNSGPFNVSDTTDLQFDAGTRNNTDASENSLHRLQLSEGVSNIIEDFEDNSNIYYQVKNRIYFCDFEDQDISDWTLNPKVDGQTGISSINIVGNYGLRIDGNDRAYSPSFDCSGKTDIKLRLYLAGVSLEGIETMMVGWFDGTTWQTVQSISNGFNGYVTLDIPDAWLASNNQLVFDLSNNGTLFGGTNAGNDSGYVDDIEVYYITQEPVELSNSPYFVYEGSYSGKYQVDFTKDYNEFFVDINPVVNISTDKCLKLRMFKPNKGVYQYKITVIDSSGAEWNTGLLDFPNNNWFTHSILISNITGIDKTSIAQIKISFEETIANAVLWDGTYDTAGSTVDTFSVEDVNAYQSFIVDEPITVGRIEIAVRRTSYPPRVPFYIAIANVFGTTYAIARFDGSQVPTANIITYIIADFDNNITLYPGNIYKLLFFTTEDTWDYYWQTKLTANNFYLEGDFYFNDWINPNDLVFRLFAPKVKEYIYIDSITREAESTYSATGSFISRAFNLSTIPTAVIFEFSRTGTGDTITKYIRFASTEAGLSSAVWNDVTSDVFTGIPLGQWFQYRIDFSGPTTEADSISNMILIYESDSVDNAIIISKSVIAESQPDTFIPVINDEMIEGLIDYYISRNNGLNWQYIDRSQFNNLLNFSSNAGFGNEIKLKAIITGQSKLYGWALSLDKEIV